MFYNPFLKHLRKDKPRPSIWKRRWQKNYKCCWPRLWLHWDGTGLSLLSRPGMPGCLVQKDTILFELSHLQKRYNPIWIRSPPQTDSMTLTTWLCGELMVKIWTTPQFGEIPFHKKYKPNNAQVGHSVCSAEPDCSRVLLWLDGRTQSIQLPTWTRTRSHILSPF